MKTILIIIICLFLMVLTVSTSAQDPKLLPDKPGTFKVLNWSVHGMSGTDYTKAETQANLKRLETLADILRQNPILANPRGFDSNARLYGRAYDKKVGYGIPCGMSIEFCYFFVNSKGKEVKVDIEPPNWSIDINNLKCRANTGLGVAPFTPDEKTKPGFNYEKWSEVGEKLRNMFYQPGKKETVARGVDRYDDNYVVVYNPDNPAYWVPVTIREAYTSLIDYWKLHPYELESEMMLKMLEAEYAQVPESDRDSYAYFGRNPNINENQITGFCPDSTQNPLVRINTAYWNKKLPRSAIQILSFNCPADKKFLAKEIEAQQDYRTGAYYINRFQEALDLVSLQKIIE